MKKTNKKTGDKILMAKTRSNTGEKVKESPGFYVYYYLIKAFSVSTDRGTSLALIYVGKLK